MALVMASKSPRRRELMGMVTGDFEVDAAQVDEKAVSAANPAALAQRLAQLKGAEVFARRPKDVVVGCDTVVEIDGLDLGKPGDLDDARRMLGLLSGRAHKVHTGLAVYLPDGTVETGVETSLVYFSELPQNAVEAYIATDEAYDKAGGYAIQGWAARYIYRIEGCYYNIMGLPVAGLYRRLVALGVL